MTLFYFVIEQVKKGWLTVDAETVEEATQDVQENGFDVDCWGSENSSSVEIISEGFP